MLDPVCAAAGTLQHSTPSVRWWLGLNAGEQAAWAAAFVGLLAAAGGFAAAVASFWAAKTALEIAKKEDERQDTKSARRAEVHAAYIFNEIALVYGFIQPVQASASGLAAATDYTVMRRLGAQLFEHAKHWNEAINDVRPESVAELPEECAAWTAGAMSAARFASRLAYSIQPNLTQDGFAMDAQRKVAATVETHCVQIQKNFEPYLKYCRETFGAVL